MPVSARSAAGRDTTRAPLPGSAAGWTDTGVRAAAVPCAGDTQVGARRGTRLVRYGHQPVLVRRRYRLLTLTVLAVTPGILRLQRYRRTAQGLVRRTRQGQPELRSSTGLAPGLQPAAVEAGVLDRDREPQAGAAGGAGTGRVRPPEAVEDPGRLARLESHAVVPDRHGHGALRDAHVHDDVPALAVLDGVDDEIAQDPLDTARVGLRDHGLFVPHDADPGSLALGQRLGATDHPSDDRTQIYRLGFQRRGPRVEPADLQQIGEERLEAVELVAQQLRGTRRDRVEVDTCLVDDVGGHPHGRQGCAARG